jgi:hypothetical protein
VTTTRAELIRALASDGLTREQIATKTGATRQAIASALAHNSRLGRPRTRCDVCVCKTCGGTWEPSRKRGKKP